MFHLAWPYAALFWAVVVWAFIPELRILARRDEPITSAQDANSKRLIAIGGQVSAIAAFVVAGTVPSANLAGPEIWFWIGICALVAGSLLRRHCWQVLGKSFTGTVIVTQNQAVVDTGAYRYVRHPSYTGGTIMCLGIALALANWLSIVILLLGTILAYAYRVHVEERALIATIGEPYEAYMDRTKRFVPFVF